MGKRKARISTLVLSKETVTKPQTQPASWVLKPLSQCCLKITKWSAAERAAPRRMWRVEGGGWVGGADREGGREREGEREGGARISEQLLWH